MKYLELELTNWGPHQHRLLKFDPEAKVIAIAGENDKGKSWTILAMASLFVTGRNEYFDKNAIFDGENEARIRGKILDNQGKPHEILRILRRKENEEDEIYFDGTLYSPTKYTELLCEEFKVQDPKILLSLAISLQGETHFYLKAKKRDREEGLRSLTQLDRIDSWKEHLTKLTNFQDKKFAEEKNTLIGKKLNLEEILKATALHLQKLQEEKAELEKGTLEDGTPWSLAEQIQAVSTWETLQEEITRTQREITNLQNNLTLYEGALGKAEQQKEGSPLKNLSAEEIAQKEEKLTKEEAAFREARIWKKKEAKERELEVAQTATTNLQKEIEAIKLPLSTEEENNLTLCKEEYLLSQKSLNRLTAPKRSEADISKELEAKRKELAERKEQETTAKDATTTASRLRRLVEGSLQELGINPKGKTTTETKTLLEKTIGEIRKSLQSKKVSPSEANLLKQRLLSNWEEEGTNLCPITEENLAQYPGWKTSEERKATLAQLQEALQSQEDNNQWELPGGEELKNLINLERLNQIDLPELEEEEAKALEKSKTLEGKPSSTLLSQEIESLEKEATNQKSYQAALSEQKSAVEALLKNCTAGKGETPEEKANDLLQACQKAREEITTKTATLNTKKEEIKKITAELAEIQSEVPEQKNPQIRVLLLEDEKDLKEQHTQVTSELETLRTNRNQLSPILEKIQTERAKVEQTKKAISEKQASLQESQKKTPQSLGLLVPKEKTLEETLSFWKSKQKRQTEVETLLQAETPKEKETREILAETTRQIENLVKKAADIEAAQEVVNFLDHKNAPRKLLSRTVDRIFSRANKLAKTFGLNMVLSQGKNLEFNNIQMRNGREITQKTERLGFGKANVLGITTRLAAQEILAPRTGFLCLDEPSAYIDSMRKNALREFLQKLAEGESEHKTQIIIVEHEESIAQAANQIIWID